MATKSILKNITIKDKKNAEMLVTALENAESKKAQRVNMPSNHYATQKEVDKLVFASK